MKRLELWIFVGFAIAFMAGLTVGRLRFRTDAPAAPYAPAAQPVQGVGVTAKPDDHFPTLGKQLNLSPAQKRDMDAIWKEARSDSDKLHQSITEDGEARKSEIAALLTAAQLQADYKRIQDAHDAQVEKLRLAIAKRMREADAKTRGLLTPDQLKRFEEMANDHRRHHGPPPMGGPAGPGPGFGPHHFHHHGPDTATSRPETGPSSN